MAYHSIPGSARKRCMVFAIAAAALVVVFAPAARAQNTTWTIIIDATVPGRLTTADYKLIRNDDPGGGCHYQNYVPTILTICEGDTVQWQTSTGTAQNKTEMWIFHRDAILDDTHGQSATHIHHAQGGGHDGGKTDAHAPVSPKLEHEYYIFVQNGNDLCYDDPKIIIGGTKEENWDEQINQIRNLVKELKAKNAAAKTSIQDIIRDLDSLKKNRDDQ